jgi:predicted ATP-dependent serine protease
MNTNANHPGNQNPYARDYKPPQERVKTAFDLLNDEQHRARLPIGCPGIDSCIGGGIRTEGVTEICGEAASGKTQICLHLLLQVQSQVSEGGLNGSAFYVSTEGDAPMKRLQQMAVGFATRKFGSDRGRAEAEVTRLMEGIFIEVVQDLEQLVMLLERRLPVLLNATQSTTHRPVRIVVVDSIAALFRGEFISGEREDIACRAALLMRLGSVMKMHSSGKNRDRLDSNFHMSVCALLRFVYPSLKQENKPPFFEAPPACSCIHISRFQCCPLRSLQPSQRRLLLRASVLGWSKASGTR